MINDLNLTTPIGDLAADAEVQSAKGNEKRCFPHAANCTFSVSDCTCHVRRIQELEEQLKAAQESLFTVSDLYRMATARCEAAEDQLEEAQKHSTESVKVKVGADSRGRMIQ